MQSRKPNRLNGYDYSQNGVYFLTLCSKDKQCIFGRVVGDGVLDVPQMILSDYGKVVEKHIVEISKAYEHILIDNYVIMPNHIHLLVMIYSDERVLNETLSGSPQNAEIPKLISTLKRFVNGDIGENVWQRSYHDHIVRNEPAYNSIWEYIEYNASKWKEDCFYTK